MGECQQYKYALTDGKPITASSVELDFLAAKRGELVKEFKETVKSVRRVAREKGKSVVPKIKRLDFI